jgi:HK97 gp10 family phage protein
MAKSKIVSAKVTGFKQLNKALDSLIVDKFRKAAMVNAGKAVMRPVLSSAIANAPTLNISDKNPDHAIANELKNDIKMSSSFNATPYTKSGNAKKNLSELLIKVSTGTKTKDYAINAEYGRPELTAVRTEAFGRQTKLFTSKVPEMKPQPFMLPALKSIEGNAHKTFGVELGKSIKIQVKKHAKFAKKGAK